MANAVVYAQCRALLEAEAANLRTAIADLTADEGTAEEKIEAGALADTLRETLRDIDDALAKLANDTFGTCELCKGTIADERLSEMPAARQCYDCAEISATVITANREID